MIETDSIGNEEVPEKTRPNKSQMKREMEKTKVLSQKLAELTPNQMAKVELADELVAAIRLARKISANKKAHRRQVLFIARIVSNLDLDHILSQLEKLRRGHHD